MRLGLLAKIDVDPRHVFADRWSHDIANALCRDKLELERRWLAARKDGAGYWPAP